VGLGLGTFQLAPTVFKIITLVAVSFIWERTKLRFVNGILKKLLLINGLNFINGVKGKFSTTINDSSINGTVFKELTNFPKG